MLVFFEDHQYPQALISKYFTEEESKSHYLEFQHGNKGRWSQRIGYLFVSGKHYSGPVFFLPKTFLQKDASDPNGNDVLFGMPGIVPEGIVDTEDEDNVLTAAGARGAPPVALKWVPAAAGKWVPPVARNRVPCKEPVVLSDKLHNIVPNQDETMLWQTTKLQCSNSRECFSCWTPAGR